MPTSSMGVKATLMSTDLDVLFELDEMGKMVSHSRCEGLNQYDGMTLPDFLDVIRGLYP